MPDPVIQPATQPAQDVLGRLSNFFGGDAVEATPVSVATPEVPETPTEATEVEAAAEVPEEGTEQPDQPAEEQSEADSLVEVEVDGKLLKVDPNAKDYLMRHADYTKKTMELSEHRKLFQREREIADMQAAFSKEIAPETQQLAELDSQISQFKKLDWSAMDTDQIVRARQALDAVKDQKSELEKTLGGKRDEFLNKYAKSKEQLLQQGGEYLSKTVPNWGSISQKESAQAALGVGFSREEVSNFMDPRAVHLAWKAAQWDKLQSAKPQVTQKVSKAPPVTKPGSKGTTDSQATQDFKNMRQTFKKSGDWRDGAKLLEKYMFKGK